MFQQPTLSHFDLVDFLTDISLICNRTQLDLNEPMYILIS